MDPMLAPPPEGARDFKGIPASVSISMGLWIAMTAVLGSTTSNSNTIFLVTATVTVAVGIAASMVTWLMKKDDGTAEMREIVDAIRKGSEGFFKTQVRSVVACITLITRAANAMPFVNSTALSSGSLS
jgi:hypothetical protein